MNATARRPRTLARSVLLVALSGSLLLAAPAAVLAGKPHGGGGGTTSGGATVTAAPNPVVLGAPLTVSGSGYAASTQLQVEFRTSGSDGYIYAASDAYGRFTPDDVDLDERIGDDRRLADRPPRGNPRGVNEHHRPMTRAALAVRRRRSICETRKEGRPVGPALFVCPGTGRYFGWSVPSAPVTSDPSTLVA